VTVAGRPQDGISIGALLAQLRPDFPDVTISKIRFLEAEGLVRPARTAAGYRQFAPADIARLRFVLSAQRDHYLPLKVIREQLDAVDRGRRPATPSPTLPQPLDPPDARDFTPATQIRLTREELAGAADIDGDLLTELEGYGLIRTDPAGCYDADAVLVARTAKAMTRFGLEPRHLRAFRASADREVGLVEQVIAPLHRDAGRAEQVTRELAALSVRLHTLLVKTGLTAGRGRPSAGRPGTRL
jgi:DNA-binding transcriptional MerR regulator